MWVYLDYLGNVDSQDYRVLLELMALQVLLVNAVIKENKDLRVLELKDQLDLEVLLDHQDMMVLGYLEELVIEENQDVQVKLFG